MHQYVTQVLVPRAAIVVGLFAVAVVATESCSPAEGPDRSTAATWERPGRGKIKGRVRITGIPPANDRIRMRADPMCDKANSGHTVLQETVVVGPDGSLANA